MMFNYHADQQSSLYRQSLPDMVRPTHNIQAVAEQRLGCST